MKSLFSVTRHCAPVHSVNAAMKASPPLSPILSYLAPSTNGTSQSSSTDIPAACNRRQKSLKRCGAEFFRTSSRMVRERRTWNRSRSEKILSKRASQEDFLSGPKTKRYSLESRTSCKFFLPNSFPRPFNRLDDLLFGHPLEMICAQAFPFELAQNLQGFSGVGPLTGRSCLRYFSHHRRTSTRSVAGPPLFVQAPSMGAAGGCRWIC